MGRKNKQTNKPYIYTSQHNLKKQSNKNALTGRDLSITAPNSTPELSSKDLKTNVLVLNPNNQTTYLQVRNTAGEYLQVCYKNTSPLWCPYRGIYKHTYTHTTRSERHFFLQTWWTGKPCSVLLHSPRSPRSTLFLLLLLSSAVK